MYRKWRLNMMNQKYRLKSRNWLEFDNEENKSVEFNKIQNKLLKIVNFPLLQLMSLQLYVMNSVQYIIYLRIVRAIGHLRNCVS